MFTRLRGARSQKTVVFVVLISLGLTRLSSEQQPLTTAARLEVWSSKCRSVLMGRRHLQYARSSSNRTIASRIPDPRSRKVEKNCSRARGSLRLCFSLFMGLLHAPVNQKRRNRSRSPATAERKLSVTDLLNSYSFSAVYTEGEEYLHWVSGRTADVWNAKIRHTF